MWSKKKKEGKKKGRGGRKKLNVLWLKSITDGELWCLCQCEAPEQTIFWIEWILHSISTALHFTFYGSCWLLLVWLFSLTIASIRTDCENELLSSSNAVFFMLCVVIVSSIKISPLKSQHTLRHYFYHHRHAFCSAIAFELDWEKLQTQHTTTTAEKISTATSTYKSINSTEKELKNK